MSESWRWDLTVSGGGMVGAALAFLSARTGFSVRLFEQRERDVLFAPDPLERVSLITLGSARILAGQGVLMEELGTPVQRMRVWDGQGFGSIHLDAEDAGEAVLGYIVENRRLEQALHRALADGGIPVDYGQRVLRTHPWGDHLSLEMERGPAVRTTLLAVAEGRRSPLRQSLGLPLYREDYGQEGITATVWVEQPHRSVAYQRFLPTGPLAFLPFAPDADGNPRCSIVWSAKRPLARRLMAMGDRDFLAALNEAFGPQLGLIHRTGVRGAFPLSGLHSQSYLGPRMALLGDSAHGVHPLAGLGVNLGLRDAGSLAEVIHGAAARHEDWGEREVLRRYETARRPDNLLTVLACGGLSHLFSNRSRPLAWVRDAGMSATGLVPPLKRFLIRQAMGL